MAPLRALGGVLLVHAATAFTVRSPGAALVSVPVRIYQSSGKLTTRTAEAKQPAPDFDFLEPMTLATDESFDPPSEATRLRRTLVRVALPTIIMTVAGACAFPVLSRFIKQFLDPGQLSILGNDSSQFVQVRHFRKTVQSLIVLLTITYLFAVSAG